MEGGTVQYGIEVDLDNFAGEFGGRPIRLASHGGVPRHREAVLDRLDAGGRNISDHIART